MKARTAPAAAQGGPQVQGFHRAEGSAGYVRNARLLLVLLPFILGLLVNRFIPLLAGALPLLAWIFLALWAGFGLWIFRSEVNRALAVAAGAGTPIAVWLLYVATAGTRPSIYPQLYFSLAVPAAAQFRDLLIDPIHTDVGSILRTAALLMAAAFLAGFFWGWFRSRQSRRVGAAL